MARLLVINSAEQAERDTRRHLRGARRGRPVERLAADGIAHDIRQLDVNDDPAESILSSVSDPSERTSS